MPSPAADRRKRLAGGAAIAAGLVLVVATTLVRVPPADRAVRSWRGGGTPELLAPGLAMRLLLFQTVERFPAGAVHAEGVAEVASREGSTVQMTIEATARPSDQELLRLVQVSAPGGASQGLLSAARDQLLSEAAGMGSFDLVSGTARPELARRVRDRLADRFGTDLEIQLGEPVASAELRASFAREAIFGRRVETDLNLVLIGLDGADWDIIDPMVARGDLPNLGRLKKEGAWARLRSSVPTLSPLLWTTVATGKGPDRHGINDFLVADPRTGRRVPINSTFRRVRAFWNILSEAGLPNDVIAWWATWPAEAIRGHLVSDRVAYSTFNLTSGSAQKSAVHPPEYAATVDRLRLREEDVSHRQVSRFLHISEAEFRAARALAAPDAAPTDTQRSINVFVRVLAATETYRRVALDLLDHDAPRPRLFAVYFEGIDEVNHRFAHCAPPRIGLCSSADFARFHDAVAEFYRYQDAIVGEILARAPHATTLVLSDHGFASGERRPDDVTPFIEGKPGLWHDLIGVFMADGPGLSKGEIPAVTLYDIAPTLLYLLGLPVPEDMPGKVLEKAVAPAFLQAHAIARVPSYEPLTAEAAAAPQALGSGAAAEDQIIDQLRSLGYVGGKEPPPVAVPATPSAPAGPAAPPGPGSPQGVPTLLYHTNLAAVLIGRRQFDQAEAEYRKALALDPDAPEALTGLAALYEIKGEPGKALDILRGLVSRDPHDAGTRVIKMAELYVRLERPADGMAYFESLQRAPGSPPEVALRTALGIVEAAAGRTGEAERDLRRALQIEPASVAAMQELFPLLDAQDRAATLEPLLREGLRREPRSAMYHNYMGLALKRRGDFRGAEMAFRQTLEVAPDLVGAMANLGGLYLAENRAPEAVAVLTSALEKEPRNIESRTNLIVALGLEKNLDAARDQVVGAEKLGLRAASLYNAMAYALHVNGRSEEALAALRQALAIDPRSADSLRLQQEIERGGAVPATGYR